MPLPNWPSKEQLMNAYPGLAPFDYAGSAQEASSFQPNSTPFTPSSRAPQSDAPAQQAPQTPAQAMAGGSGSAAQPTDSNPQADYGKMMLALSGMRPEDIKRAEESIGAQQKGVEELGDYQKALREAPVQTDLGPSMAFADYITGGKSNFAKTYEKPQSGEDRIGALAKIQNMSQEQRNKISQDLIKVGQGKSAASALGNLQKNENLRLRESKGAEDQYDKQLLPIRTALDTSGRINDLLDAVDRGELVPTQNLLDTITEEQGKLATGKTNYPEGTVERLRYTNTMSDLQKLKQKFSGMPQGYLSKQTAKQIRSEQDVFTRGYMGQGDRINQTLMSTPRPLQQQIYDQRHKAFKSGYKDQFGYWGKKNNTSSTPHGVDPKDWAAATPQQQQEFLEHMNGR